MGSSRTLPLFDPGAQPSSWNERMAPGEFAVHESSSDRADPSCTVLPSLPEAEAYAQAQLAARPGIRCRIYDHQGFIGAPLREFRGNAYQGEREITPLLRRWLGSSLLLIGLVLILIDWHADFRLSWPALIGSRLLIPGLVLLVTEALLLLHAKQKARQAREGSAHSTPA